MAALGSGLSFDKVDRAALDDDPFWSAVRRRHPDVGVVLLPDDGPDPTPGSDLGPGLDLDTARGPVLALVDTWRVIAAVVAERSTTDASGDAGPSLRWGEGDGGHALVARSNVPGLGVAGGIDLVRAVAVALDARGWRFAPTRRAGHPLLRATDGRLDLEAEVGEAITAITLATGVLPVADDVRVALLDGLDGEVR